MLFTDAPLSPCYSRHAFAAFRYAGCRQRSHEFARLISVMLYAG